MRHVTVLAILCIAVFFSLSTTAAESNIAEFGAYPANVRADSLISAGGRLLDSDSDTALKYFETALELSRKISYVNGQADALRSISLLHYSTRDYEAATGFLEDALELPGIESTYKDIATIYYDYGHALNGAGKTEAAREAYHKSLAIHRAANDSLGIATLSRALGLFFIRTTRYDSSLVYYTVARDYFRALGNMQRLAAMINSIGVSYYQLGLYELALKNYQEALAIRRDINDLEGVSRVLNNIGLMEITLENTNDAPVYFNEAIRIAKEIDNVAMIGYSLNNMGDLMMAENKLESALDYYRQALDYRRRQGERTNYTLNLNAIGSVLTKMGRFEEAMAVLEEADTISQEISFRLGMATTLKNLGVAYAAAGNTGKAFDAFDKSIEITENTGNRELHSDTLRLKAALFEKTGNYKNALRFFKLYSTLEDSLFGEETAKNIDRLKIVYETEQKERENELLRQRQKDQEALLGRNKAIIILISLLLAMAAVFAVVLYALYDGKKRANDDLTETNRKITEQRDEIKRKNIELEEAISHINTLSGLLPICSSCKKIRDDQGYWEEVEGYITRHSDAMFSHGICPDCFAELYPDLLDDEEGKQTG